MTWSFSSAHTNPAEALADFKQRADNDNHIGERRAVVKQLAEFAVSGLPQAAKVCIRSHGHFDAAGSGGLTIAIDVLSVPQG